MTNSQSWQMSGQEAKAAGVEEMRAAKRTKEDGLREGYGQRDPKELEAEGRQEGAWGKAAGCPGMEERGDEKVRAACGRQDG